MISEHFKGNQLHSDSVSYIVSRHSDAITDSDSHSLYSLPFHYLIPFPTVPFLIELVNARRKVKRGN